MTPKPTPPPAKKLPPNPDVVLIHDSICKHINPGILSKHNLVTTKILAYTLEEAQQKIDEMNISNPKVVILNVGTNDVRDKVDPDVIVRKYGTILDLLRRKFPNAKLIFSNILPREDSNDLQATVEYVNAVAYRKLAAKRHAVVKNNELSGNKLKSKDGIHLSTLGVSRLACSIRDSVLSVLGLK